MADTSIINEIIRPVRRSTRIKQAITLVVMGVDSYRGPYREEVATVSLSCHGCKYESKHDVLTNSWVMLEIKHEDAEKPPVRTRGLVKWVQRAVDSGGFQQTAIELEDPGNVWGVENAPEDWFPYVEPTDTESRAEKLKPFAVRKPEMTSTAIVRDAYESAQMYPTGGAEKPVGQLIGDLHRQMEQTLFAVAVSAVRERSAVALEEVREKIREEASKIVSDAAAAQSKAWVAQFTRDLKQVSAENAQEFHTQWEQTIRADLESAATQIKERSQKLESEAEKLAASAIERVQRGLEASCKDTVARIVDRLKTQIAPVLEEARKATLELNKTRENLEKVVDESGEKVAGRIEEAYSRFDLRFEEIAAKQIETAREEMGRVTETATNLAMSNLALITQHQAAESKGSFAAAIESAAQEKLKAIEERADDSMARFSTEIENHSRKHLEFVGSALSNFAKAIGKPPQD